MDLDQFNQPELAPEPALPDPEPPAPEPQPPTPEPQIQPPATKRRARGKIARMKPTIREKINLMLDEGLTYAEIIIKIEPEAPGLNEMDICRWYKSGHQDWLKNQLWLDETRSRLDLAIDVIAEHEGSNVHLANLHVAATQLIQDLLHRGQDLLTQHTDQYVNIINSIARLGHEALTFQKYSEVCARAREEICKLKDPNRKLSDAETRAIVDRVDRILGFK
jgi:hypothetical protein